MTIPNAQSTDGGNYKVNVIGEVGFMESEIATIQVTAPALPFADFFDARGAISGMSGTGQGSNRSAMIREFGESQHGSAPIWYSWRTVWVSWTAPESGVATMSTTGSNFDALLAVYTGDKVSALSGVASDDDSDGYLNSLVQFNAQAGVEYQVVVASGLDSGNIVLNWHLIEDQMLPNILEALMNVTTTFGGRAALSIIVDPASPVDGYQWSLNGTPIADAVQSTFVLDDVQAENVGSYSVELAVG